MPDYDKVKSKQQAPQAPSGDDLFRLLVENARDYAIFTMDVEGRVTSWNTGVERFFGYMEEEILSQNGDLLFTSEDRECGVPEQELHKAASEGRAEDERWHLRKNGTRFWVSGIVEPLRDDARNLLGFVKIVRDLSGRKHAERPLTVEHTITRILSESATLGEATPQILQTICETLRWDLGSLWSRDIGVLRCVEMWRDPSVKAEEFVDVCRKTTFVRGVGLPGSVWKTGATLWVADITESELPRRHAASRDGLHGAVGFPILLGSEILGVLEFFSREIREPDQELLSMMSAIGSQIGQFIERRHAERAVKFQAHLLDTVEQAVISTDLAGNVTYWNRFAEKLYGWTSAEAVGRNVLELIPAPATQEQASEIMSYLSEGRSWSGEFLVRHKDDTPFPIMVTNSPIYDEEGGLVGIVGISFDITERKRAEESLRKAHDELERRVEERTVELANANAMLTQEIAERQRAEQTLRENHNLLQWVIEGTTDFIFVKDFSGRYLMINSAAASFVGKPAEEILGKNDTELFPPEIARNLIEYDRQVMATGEARASEETLPSKGALRTVSEVKSIYRNDKGEAIGLIGIARDITERKRMEEALRESEERYKGLADTAFNGVVIHQDGLIKEVNRAYAEMYGYTPEELKGQNILVVTPPQQRDLILSYITNAVETPYEALGLKKDGTLINIEVSAKNCFYEGRPARLAAVRDVTERVRAREARIQLQLRLLAAQEEERHRISRELHDQMGQHLPALMLGLKALKDGAYSGPPAVERLQRLQDLAELIARDVHTLARELRPVGLDDLGLHTALSNYVEEWSAHYGITVDFHSRGFDENKRLPPHDEITLYRTVQEALTNVIKHAQAKHVSLILERSREAVLTVVEDDGKGFDVEAVRDTPISERRLGLLGMQERVELVGGTLEIESVPGAGTTIAARIPTLRR
jgi:PAS domain S-box-containing protein